MAAISPKPSDSFKEDEYLDGVLRFYKEALQKAPDNRSRLSILRGFRRMGGDFHSFIILCHYADTVAIGSLK